MSLSSNFLETKNVNKNLTADIIICVCVSLASDQLKHLEFYNPERWVVES